mgnify:CR=1 FL=1
MAFLVLLAIAVKMMEFLILHKFNILIGTENKVFIVARFFFVKAKTPIV